jgi:ABC-2 type transport system permease protein
MNYIVPGLIAVIMMMTSALLTSGTISRERERGTIEQLIASPLRPWELMLGKIAAYALVACLDVVIVVALGRAWFGVPLRGSLWLLAGGSALFLMSSLGLGLLISSAIPSQQAAMVAAIMVTMVPSILLSGFYFPIGSMPPVVQAFTTIVPARYFLALVRGVFLKGSGMAELWPNLAALGCMGLLLMTASIRAFKKRL